MTDVQQVEPSRTKTRKRARKNKPDEIDFNTAVTEGKKIVATALKSHELKLGELADRVEPKYGDKTLLKFAKAIGLHIATVSRCRSVYRAWKKIKIKGPSPNFGVYQALQGHPEREEIINKVKPKTVKEARTIMRDYRKAHGLQEEWQVGETRRLLAEAVKHALEAHKKYGHLKPEHLDPNILRQAVDEPDKLVDTLRMGGRAFITLADEIVSALTTPPALLPPPMFDDTDQTE